MLLVPAPLAPLSRPVPCLRWGLSLPPPKAFNSWLPEWRPRLLAAMDGSVGRPYLLKPVL